VYRKVACYDLDLIFSLSVCESEGKTFFFGVRKQPIRMELFEIRENKTPVLGSSIPIADLKI